MYQNNFEKSFEKDFNLQSMNLEHTPIIAF